MCAFDLGPVGVTPSFGVPATDLGYSMMNVASAMGVPGFGIATAAFPFIAGVNWTSGSSSYAGTPGFRGVADMAWATSGSRQSTYGLSGGLGLYGMSAPMMSFMPSTDFLGVGNILGNVWQGLVANMFGSAPQQQPAGPAQPAAPQPPAPQPAASPTQVNASAGSGGAVRGGRRVPTTPLSPAEQARLQALDTKKNSSIPLWGGLNTTEQQEYDRLMSRVPPRPRARARP